MNGSFEEWRVIADFPCYAVSDHGRVKRIAPTARSHKVTGQCLKAVTARGRAYQFVSLCRDGYTKQVRVNRIVCEAFHGPPPSDYHHAAHNDGDASNNRADNLRWATPVENEADKRKHCTAAIGDRHWSKMRVDRRARGEAHGRTKLTERAVRAIKTSSASSRKIAKVYGISQATVINIRRGRTWGHVA